MSIKQVNSSSFNNMATLNKTSTNSSNNSNPFGEKWVVIGEWVLGEDGEVIELDLDDNQEQGVSNINNEEIPEKIKITDLEIKHFGNIDNSKIYQVGNIVLTIYENGKIEISKENQKGRIDITNAEKININKKGIQIVYNDCTWTITNDNKTTYTNNNIKTTLNYDICNISINNNTIRLDKLNINKNEKLIFKDKKTNTTVEFDSLGRIKTYTQDEIKIEYNYKPTEKDKNKILEYDDFYKENKFDINYVATATIKGHELSFTSIGDQEGYNTTNYPIIAAQEYSSYNDRILSSIEKYFKGTIIGPWELANLENHETVAGFASSNLYIFIPNESCETIQSNKDLVHHEMGHIIHYTKMIQYYVPINNYKVNSDDLYKLHAFENDVEELYDQYKDVITQLPYSGYNKETGYPESPNEHEFIADATANYFLDPSTLKRYAPELYDLIDGVYGKEDIY